LSAALAVRAQSFAGSAQHIVGLIFVGLGVAFVMPLFGLIGLAWTAIAGAITFYHAYNFFSRRGISTYEINVDQNLSDNVRRR